MNENYIVTDKKKLAPIGLPQVFVVVGIEVFTFSFSEYIIKAFVILGWKGYTYVHINKKIIKRECTVVFVSVDTAVIFDQ